MISRPGSSNKGACSALPCPAAMDKGAQSLVQQNGGQRTGRPRRGKHQQRPLLDPGQQHGANCEHDRVLQDRRGIPDRGLGADGPGPSQFMLEPAGKGRVRHRGRRQRGGQPDRQPLCPHQLSEHGIVGQVVGQGFQPTHPRQRVPPDRHRDAQAVLPAERTRQQHAGQEAVGDLAGRQPLQQPPGRWQPDGQRGDQPGAGLGKGGHYLAQIVRCHVQVTVGHHDHIVARGTDHVDQVGHLAVAAMLRVAHDQVDGGGREALAQPPDHGHCGVHRVGHAEHQLVGRVILGAERGQCLLQQRLVAVQRFEHAHRGQRAGRKGRLPGKPPCRKGAREGLDHAQPRSGRSQVRRITQDRRHSHVLAVTQPGRDAKPPPWRRACPRRRAPSKPGLPVPFCPAATKGFAP